MCKFSYHDEENNNNSDRLHDINDYNEEVFQIMIVVSTVI